MPPHNPNDCPRCRWLAEREEMERTPTGGFWASRSDGFVYAAPPPCESLDAVAGLMKEMQKHGVWLHGWDQVVQMWAYSTGIFGLRKRRFYSFEDLPAACVIDAAMRVLGKESDAD